MMMFLLDLAFANELIAMAVGVALLVWAFRNDGAGVKLARVFGYIITIAAVLGALCTSYFGSMYMFKGYFNKPMMMNMQMMNKQMMQQHKPMMMQDQHRR